MPSTVPGRNPTALVNLLRFVGCSMYVDERVREVLVLRAVEDDEVAAARERGVLAARAGRLELGADLALHAPAWSG